MTPDQQRQTLNIQFNDSITKVLNGGPVSPAITALLDTLATMIYSSGKDEKDLSFKIAFATKEIDNRIKLLSRTI